VEAKVEQREHEADVLVERVEDHLQKMISGISSEKFRQNCSVGSNDDLNFPSKSEPNFLPARRGGSSSDRAPAAGADEQKQSRNESAGVGVCMTLEPPTQTADGTVQTPARGAAE
jgi:hypothetical protein